MLALLLNCLSMKQVSDMNCLLLQSDHEKQVQRAKEVKVAASSAASGSSIAPNLAQSDAATLYRKQDLSLKEGQTIKYGMLCSCLLVCSLAHWLAVATGHVQAHTLTLNDS